MTVFIEGGDPLNWIDARDKIRGDLWRPGSGLPDDVIDRALHAALLELEAEQRWLWLENLTMDLVFQDVSNDMILPSVVRSVTTLSYINGKAKILLTPAPLNQVRNLNPSATGFPTFYCLGDGVVYFDTNVSAGLQLELIFSAQTPEYLADAIDTYNYTLGRHQEAVLANACWRIALGFLKDSDNAARHRAIYLNDLDRLITRENQQRTDEIGGVILPDQSYAAGAFGFGGSTWQTR